MVNFKNYDIFTVIQDDCMIIYVVILNDIIKHNVTKK